MPRLAWTARTKPQASSQEAIPRQETQSSSSNSSASSASSTRDSPTTVLKRNLKRRLRVPLISITNLYNRLQTSGLVVIDCRHAEQFVVGHVHGAFHCEHVSRKHKTIDELFHDTQNDALIRKMANRDLMEVVVIGSNRSSASLLYKRDWGYKLARLLLAEGRVFSVQFLAQGFPSFAKKYPFLLHVQPALCVGLPSSRSKSSKGKDPIQYPNEIINSFMYLGNFWQANSHEVIDALQITHVVNLGAMAEDRAVFDGVEYLDIDIKDKCDVDIRQEFGPIMSFIDQATKRRGRVLIHCVQGVSRSSTIVIWYIMLKTKCTLSAAYSYVLKRRPLIFPNRGFMKQLMENEKEMYGMESVLPEELDLLQHGLLPPMDRSGSALRQSFA